jgi:hypothetical protein
MQRSPLKFLDWFGVQKIISNKVRPALLEKKNKDSKFNFIQVLFILLFIYYFKIILKIKRIFFSVSKKMTWYFGKNVLLILWYLKK